MDKLLNKIASTVRGWMRWPAVFLNRISGGRVRPNHVTLVSLLGHFGVVWALWHARPILAALLLAVFGIMDTLDGALARLQGTASVSGMFYDAISDRAKEVLVYVGLASVVVPYGNTYNYFVYEDRYAWLLVAVCGMSLVVSYIKAKGEVAASGLKNQDAQALNRIFANGIARYEVRMALVIVGLLTGYTITVLAILLVLATFTALQRTVRISHYLRTHV